MTRDGHARVDLLTGRASFDVEGLVLVGGNSSGTPGPITTLNGTLVCNAGTGNQEIIDTATEHHERRDDASLRRQQQRLTGFADPERLHVVGDHRLQIRGRIGPTHPYEVPRTTGDTKRCDSHRRLVLQPCSGAEPSGR